MCWQLISEPWYCDSEWLCHHFCRMSQILWAFTVVMLSESSQVSKQSDAFAKSFPSVFASLWARLSTLPVRWGTLLPRHICWSYYYDPRCFRESPSNLAMLCIPGVMILAIIPESIPWCHLVSRHSIPGVWTRDSLYLPRVDSVARTFRILVTFAIVLEVRGISFFQIPWTTYGRSSWTKRSQ